MRWVYITIIAIVFVRLAVLTPSEISAAASAIAEQIAAEAHVPNAVAGILLRNRLYDTAFEVLVFTLAVLGIQYAFSMHRTETAVFHLEDPTMGILCRIGAMVSALIFLELALRGHLAPGGGFAAGVAGGTAIGLVTLTGNIHELHAFYERWHIASLEKVIVLLILFLVLMFVCFPDLQFGSRSLNTLAIPVLNVLIALKVAIGSWTIVLLFIRHRGLL
jgi:multicomponent Na+:H+ antiporter subunit B